MWAVSGVMVRVTYWACDTSASEKMDVCNRSFDGCSHRAMVLCGVAIVLPKIFDQYTCVLARSGQGLELHPAEKWLLS
jgi:hypothetical protein